MNIIFTDEGSASPLVSTKMKSKLYFSLVTRNSIAINKSSLAEQHMHPLGNS